MKILIHRRWRKQKYTIGRLFVDGKFKFNTLEDPDRGLADTMTEEEILAIKEAGDTAIPTGTYEVRLSVSPAFKNRPWAKKHNGLVPEIVNVPCFKGIRIHPGNTTKDTSGCPLVGDNSKVGELTNSVKRYDELMGYISQAQEAGEKIEITIM